ncbi:hypothetical protein PAMA_011978 [Pampus argenteus]
MAELAAAAVVTGSDINTAGNPTEVAMAYLQDEKTDGEITNLNLGQLDLTTDEFILDEVDIHIQANLEDDLVKEALKTRMEGMLSGFQSDLSSISSEIQTLQQQSVSMNVRLKNRQAVRSHLSQLVDELVVPGAMISTILDSPVTEQEFLEQLHELNNKINFAKELSFRETLACSDIQDIVDRLKLKVLESLTSSFFHFYECNCSDCGIKDQRVHSSEDLLLQEANDQLPDPTEHSAEIQFLLANERTVAKEIRDEYVDTMSKIYYSYFKSYSGRLLKVQVNKRFDTAQVLLMLVDGVSTVVDKQGFFSKPSLKSRNTIFTVGQRGAILSPAELEGPILVPHTAQRGDSRYPYETLFRSQHYALLDNGCREFLFLSDFFMVAGNSALDLFNSIMGKTLSMFLKSMSTYVSDCYDSIAVFLCIHIILRFRAITAKRNIPALDKSVLHQLNPFISLYNVEVENFVLKMAAEFPSRRDQLIFLINNYDMMLSVLMERAADDSKEVEGFQQLLLARTQEFIEEILSPPFGGMIAFVKEAEALMEKGQLDRLKNEEARITQLIRGFSGTWKQSVESMSQDVMRSFTNFKNGTSIIQVRQQRTASSRHSDDSLQEFEPLHVASFSLKEPELRKVSGALTQLIQYYHGFHKVLNQPTFRSLAVRSELINLHHLMVEVKKHKPNF